MASLLTERLARRLGALLRARSLTLAAAESCTGGRLCAAVTAVAGASRYFRGGVVAYDDAVKRRSLGVPARLIARRGAVSGEVAQAMARGAATVLRAEVGVGITGIAGPSGGSPGKPVGTVWIAVSGPGVLTSRCFRFRGGRKAVQEAAVRAALGMIVAVVASLEAGGGKAR